MKLLTIDKSRYQKHSRYLTIACITILLAAALLLSTLLVSLLGAQQTSNFYLNMSAVAISVVITAGLVYQYRSHTFLHESYYVWRLKFELSHINRKIRQVEQAAQKIDVNALLILSYYYQASHQIWTLDDNNISMDTLAIKQRKLDELVLKHNLSIDANDYQRELLSAY